MTIEKLMKYCLQYLEQDSETDIMHSDISSLLIDDTFTGAILNMEHPIYMALTRYASSNVLLLQEAKFPDNSNCITLSKTFRIPVRNTDGTLMTDATG